jgi:predicted ArsR family transcriptional regulator
LGSSTSPAPSSSSPRYWFPDKDLVIQGYSCPLAALTPDHPEVCRMAETLVTEVAGVPVYERCDRGERPRCCFEVSTSNNDPEHK